MDAYSELDNIGEGGKEYYLNDKMQICSLTHFTDHPDCTTIMAY